MGTPILMYQLKSLLNEISWKFKEDTKIYAYDKTLFINLCLQPNLKHEGQINLIYHTSQGNLLYVPFKKGNREDFHSSLINEVNLIVIIWS